MQFLVPRTGNNALAVRTLTLVYHSGVGRYKALLAGRQKLEESLLALALSGSAPSRAQNAHIDTRKVTPPLSRNRDEGLAEIAGHLRAITAVTSYVRSGYQQTKQTTQRTDSFVSTLGYRQNVMRIIPGNHLKPSVQVTNSDVSIKKATPANSSWKNITNARNVQPGIR